MSWSAADGSFVGAYHSERGPRINRSVIHEDGRTELWEHDVASDGTLAPHRHEDDTGYDPRTRPFYELASDAQRRTWTPPYVFFEQGIPGITCATPYLERSTLRGVITIDAKFLHYKEY